MIYSIPLEVMKLYGAPKSELVADIMMMIQLKHKVTQTAFLPSGEVIAPLQATLRTAVVDPLPLANAVLGPIDVSISSPPVDPHSCHSWLCELPFLIWVTTCVLR